VLVPLLVVVALHAFTQRVALPGRQTIELSVATRVHDATLQPPNAAGAPTRLPYLKLPGPGVPPGPVWFDVPFTLSADASVPHAIRVEYRPALLLYLDGQLLEQTAPQELLDRSDLHFQIGSRPVVVTVPPAMLRAGEHRFQIRIGAPGYDGAALSALQFGTAEAVARLAAAEVTIRWLRAIVAVGAASLGGFLVIAWAMVRREWIYGLAGVNCLLIALLLSPALLGEAPLPPAAWRALLDAADVASKVLTLVLVLRFAGHDIESAAPWILLGVAVAVAIDASAALAHAPWTDFSRPWPWWALGARAFVLALATGVAARAAARRGGVYAIAAAAAVALGAWTWAYVSARVLVAGAFETIDLNFVGYGAWVLVIAVLLQRRYVASLRREQDARAELERLVGERTAQLEAQHAALRESERLRHAAAERERLLQEMHDGLGSRLVAAKMTAQRSPLAPQAVVRMFDELLQEMRLTVDALSVADGDLAVLLANLRHRLGPRLHDAGLVLDWRVGDTPLVPTLQGAGGRDLVRIVEEALSNVMHHAGATRVRIATGVDASGIVVTIADDGRGLPESLTPGRGMSNVRSRAARLGADVEWLRAPEGGTELRLRFPA
jgi:signal transduction histidine kinase